MTKSHARESVERWRWVNEAEVEESQTLVEVVLCQLDALKFLPTRVKTLTHSRLKVRPGPSGLHIFDRETGLNILLDEVRVPLEGWAAAPRQVSVALTNACDLSCPSATRQRMLSCWMPNG